MDTNQPSYRYPSFEMRKSSNNKFLWLVGILILLTTGILMFSRNNQNTNPHNNPSTVQTPISTVSASLTPSSQTASSSATPITSLGQRTKTSGCIALNGLEDKNCTPGAIIDGATKDQICVSGYSKSVRNVPESEKNQVYLEYGITSRTTGEYEVDHLISLELGGSNDISNLWPEAAQPTPGFHEKDKVENYLHAQVCSGTISLQDAQLKIVNNWEEVYSQMSPN